MAGPPTSRRVNLRTQRIFTVGQVAKLCGVATRTVAKWFDAGLLKGFRIPGGKDRRIPRKELIQFARTAGIHIPDLSVDETRVLVIPGSPQFGHSITSCLSTTDFSVVIEYDLFGAGLASCGHEPDVIVADAGGNWKLTSEMARDMAVRCQKLEAPPKFALIVAEDYSQFSRMADSGITTIFQNPFAIEALLAWIVKMHEERMADPLMIKPRGRYARGMRDEATAC